MTSEFFGDVWDVLVSKGGAARTTAARLSFIRYFMADHRTDDAELGPVLEYRVGGLLGFGGKFWRNAYPDRCPYYVNFYSEDRTDERTKLAGEINEVIEKLYVARLPARERDRLLALRGDD